MPKLPPPFSAPYAPDDSGIAARLLPASHLGATQEARIDHTATRLIAAPIWCERCAALRIPG